MADQNIDDKFRKKKLRKDKSWTEIRAESSWRMFKIMAEFVDGFERLDKIGPCVSVFGSARTKPENQYYQAAVKISKLLVEEGFGVITGGGPGIMEAANRGAFEEDGKSVGLNIDLPFEQGANLFIDFDKIFNYNYFFVRKVMFVKYAQAFVYLPGGFGTMDELFESLTLIQTHKIDRVPIVMVGKEYWKGLFDWITEVMLGQEHNISASDLDLFHFADEPAEVVGHIRDFYKSDSRMRPNF
jgi:uncharacterized protein (TIGR00730 family)